MYLDFEGTDDFWTDPERRYEGHLRTTVLLFAAAGFVAAWSVVLSPSMFVLAVMLLPAALLAAALTWHTRPRRIPDYTGGAATKRRRFRSSGR